MSKPKLKPKPKRKACDAGINDDAEQPLLHLKSLDLSDTQTTPRIIATALLALLPPAATKHDVVAKKLTRAFAILMAELDASNALALANENGGMVLPIIFRFRTHSTTRIIELEDDDDVAFHDENNMTVIQIPAKCIIDVMSFLKGREIVNVSTVNKAWLAVSRMPVLWPKLDAPNGLSDKMNQKTLISLLKRPQFINLKFLVMPRKAKPNTNMITSIAKVCPLLETWDVGFSTYRFGHGKEGNLIHAALKFPNISSIRTSTWETNPSDMAVAAKEVGAQLLDLRINNNYSVSLTVVLQNVALYCLNLKHFTIIEYESSPSGYGLGKNRISCENIIHLVRNCRRLEALELKNTHRIDRGDFETILDLLAQDSSTFALRKIDVVGYPFTIKSNPFSIVDN